MTLRRVVLAGATGLVGSAILEGLLADEAVATVHSLGRREAAAQHPKLTSHVVDFRALPEHPDADEVYLALGTTIKAAGSQGAFRTVDFDANLAVARGALAAGAKRCGLVSAVGADAQSAVFYNRVKGELEEALSALAFEGLVIVRPSLLLGDRAAIGQPRRPMERFGEAVGVAFGWLAPARYRPVSAAAVACVLLERVPVASGREILLRGGPGWL
jgi:uncharacterized protein YbjT (DUF2867 family)